MISVDAASHLSDPEAQSSGPDSSEPGPARVALRREAVAMAVGRRDDAPLAAFVAETDPARALRAWFGDDVAHLTSGSALAGVIDRDIALLDELLTDQLNAVLHHERFRAMEASWRGLAYLCASALGTQDVVVRVLNLSWQEVCADFDRAADFDQSHLFTKV